mmetsp:Transcript_9076/g.28121  ORF Transcript_9076/g.28121 Transcript_9076/m.28121 type:complete len:261 (+) Transcript_9076:2278-3060(+)
MRRAQFVVAARFWCANGGGVGAECARTRGGQVAGGTGMQRGHLVAERPEEHAVVGRQLHAVAGWTEHAHLGDVGQRAGALLLDGVGAQRAGQRQLNALRPHQQRAEALVGEGAQPRGEARQCAETHAVAGTGQLKVEQRLVCQAELEQQRLVGATRQRETQVHTAGEAQLRDGQRGEAAPAAHQQVEAEVLSLEDEHSLQPHVPASVTGVCRVASLCRVAALVVVAIGREVAVVVVVVVVVLVEETAVSTVEDRWRRDHL